MKKFLRWLGIIVGSLVAILLVAYLVIYFTTERRIHRVYEVATTELSIPTGAATLTRGEQLAELFGCNGCHGDDLSGRPLIDAPIMGVVYATNLTVGAGGALNEYSDAELARAIRHGVDRDGHPLLFMPSADFVNLSDEDTAALIAWLHAAPPVDNVQPESAFGPLGRVLLAFDAFPAFSAEGIDHSIVRSAPIQGATVEYGEYLAAACQGCHMANFAGGAQLGGEPGSPPSANLTPAGDLATWTAEDFINTMRTGINPSGRQLDPEMPYEVYGRLSDEDLTAIFLFLQSLPPVEAGG